VVASAMRPDLRLAESILRLRDVGFFFLTLSVFLLLARRHTSLTRLSIIVLLLVLPYGIVFGYGMEYRMLLFVPFFAILCTDVAPRRLLLSFTLLLLLVDALYCINPIISDSFRMPVNDETFWTAFARWFSFR
jgi:hypothetical protein